MGTTALKESWTETANADNALATATRAAPAGGLRHFITAISASYSVSNDGLLTLKSGTTEVARWYIYDHLEITFSSPLVLTAGEKAELELAASGTAGQIGAVNISGYTL